jgi:hypothetical protein
MTFENWELARRNKIDGAKLLHRHLPSDLSFFLLLSSIIGVVGHTSQTNYASANTFLDGLTRHRAAAGMPSVSITLPGVTDAGLFVDDAVTQRRVEALGNRSVSMAAVLAAVADAVANPVRAPVDAVVIAGVLPWARLARHAWLRRDRRFGTTRLAGAASSHAATAHDADDESAGLDPSVMLAQALGSASKAAPTEDARERVAEAVAARLAATFNVPVEGVDLSVSVASHGVDSLAAVELRNWVSSSGKAKLSIFDILQSPSLREFGSLLIDRSSLVNP